MQVLIGDILGESTTHYPGIAASVIFMGKCNFKCRFCYDFNFIDPMLCKKMDTQDVFNKVMEGRQLISGVVFDGGEPTVQAEAFAELCHLFKNEGLKVKVNTNGSNPGIIAELAARNLIDYVCVDVKAPLELADEYKRLVDVPLGNILHDVHETMKLKGAFKFILECRTTIVPGFNDHGHFIEMIAKEVRPYADLYVLQQFRPEKGTMDPELQNVAAPSRKQLLEFARRVKRIARDVRIRTLEMGEEKI